MLAIQDNQNQADLEAAQVARDLAKLALEQYEKGTYPQDLADAQTLVKMTEITVRNKEDDLEQTRSLFAKGFVTAADVKQAELSVTTVHNDLRKAQTALMVLTDDLQAPHRDRHRPEHAVAGGAEADARQAHERQHAGQGAGGRGDQADDGHHQDQEPPETPEAARILQDLRAHGRHGGVRA
jgi:hypothetical protein